MYYKYEKLFDAIKELASELNIEAEREGKIPSSEPIRDLIDSYIIKHEDICVYTFDKHINSKVFINGDWIGFTDNPGCLVNIIRNGRKKHVINIYISVYWDYLHNAIYIFSDYGRVTRPLIIINKMKSKITKKLLNNIQNKTYKWDHLISNMGDKSLIIEY